MEKAGVTYRSAVVVFFKMVKSHWRTFRWLVRLYSHPDSHESLVHKLPLDVGQAVITVAKSCCPIADTLKEDSHCITVAAAFCY